MDVAELRIEVVYCPAPGQTDRTELRLPEVSSVAEALRASGVIERHRLDPATVLLGVWCRAATPQTLLRDLDRVELYRPLTVDPKEARRLRYRRR